jgi:hypothetical protein
MMKGSTRLKPRRDCCSPETPTMTAFGRATRIDFSTAAPSRPLAFMRAPTSASRRDSCNVFSVESSSRGLM